MGENVLEEANRTISERDGSNEDGNRIEVADGNDDEERNAVFSFWLTILKPRIDV